MTLGETPAASPPTDPTPGEVAEACALVALMSFDEAKFDMHIGVSPLRADTVAVKVAGLIRSGAWREHLRGGGG